MKSTSAAVVLAAALASNVAAFPHLASKYSLAGLTSRQAADHSFIAAGPGDARSPCPGTNTLANHGYISRNGRGVTKQQYQQGFLDAFGFDFAITDAGTTNAINLQGNGQTFDLDTLNRPHNIEHDASLTRNDAQMSWNQNADNHDFNCTVWGETLALFGPVTHVDPTSANTARLGRIAQARQQDFPGWFIENDGGSLSEHSFYLNAMADPAVDQTNGPVARLDWINHWFSNEELPTALGWARPSGVSDAQFNAAVNAVQNAPTTVPAPLPNGPVCGASTPTSTPTASASSSTCTDSTGAYSPTYTSLSMSSSTGPSYGSASPKPGSTYSYSGYSGHATTTASSSAATPTSSGPAAPSVPAAVTSAAKAQASAIAGSPPTPPNGYKQVLPPQVWSGVTETITIYIEKVETIIEALCGLQGIAGAGSNGYGSSGNAPWYGSMGSSPSGSLAPESTCACQ